MEALIAQTAERIFADHVDKDLLDRAEAPASGVFPDALWRVVQDAGLHLVGRPDSGSDLGDLFGLLKVAGRHALPLPLAEVLVANAVLPDVPDGSGFATIAVDGIAPWARAASHVLDLDGAVHVAFTVEPGANIAGEPRDHVRGGRAAPFDVPGEAYRYMGLSRTSLMAGALERTMEMTVDYATERTQFGRPIAKFQAIQHSLAVLAGEVAAAVRSCDGAVEALGSDGADNQIAAAKARVGEAAGIVAEIAHQVHGAFGFTHEHSLHHYTRRLLAWRDEYGREREWQEQLGRRAAARGADQLWDFITRGQ